MLVLSVTNSINCWQMQSSVNWTHTYSHHQLASHPYHSNTISRIPLVALGEKNVITPKNQLDRSTDKRQGTRGTNIFCTNTHSCIHAHGTCIHTQAHTAQHYVCVSQYSSVGGVCSLSSLQVCWGSLGLMDERHSLLAVVVSLWLLFLLSRFTGFCAVAGHLVVIKYFAAVIICMLILLAALSVAF